MRWFGLCTFWIALYLWSDRAGEWASLYFNAYAASLSLLLIIASARIRERWADYFRALCLTRILFEVADAYTYFPDMQYDNAVSVLNMLEFMTLFCMGGLITLGKWNAQSGGLFGDTYRRFFNRR